MPARKCYGIDCRRAVSAASLQIRATDPHFPNKQPLRGVMTQGLYCEGFMMRISERNPSIQTSSISKAVDEPGLNAQKALVVAQGCGEPT
jgi:hypothetical protein